jgi:hypothetical protein
MQSLQPPPFYNPASINQSQQQPKYKLTDIQSFDSSFNRLSVQNNGPFLVQPQSEERQKPPLTFADEEPPE